jgi:hypothetical protein
MAGRPTLYKEEYCEKVIELLKQGAAMEEIALEIEVNVDTLYEWMKVHPIFSDSIKEGRGYSKGWWLKKGRVNIDNKDFNSTLWYMNMKNRFHWSDKHEVTTSDSDDKMSAEDKKKIEEIKDKYKKEY